MAKKEVIGLKPTVKDEKVTRVEQYQIFNLVVSDKVKIAIGNYLIHQNEFETVEDAKNYIDSKPWELIVNTTCCIYDISKNVEQSNN